MIKHPKLRFNDEPFFTMAARIGNDTAILDRRFTEDLVVGAVLSRMHLESYPKLLVTLEGIELKGMQRGRPGSCIDFGLDLVQAKIGQCNPFAPSELE